MDTVVTVKIIREKKEIDKLVELVSQENTGKKNRCGYDGSLHFFKQNSVVQDINFRMNDGQCMLFTFVQNGKPAATVLSKESKELLESIRNN